MSRNPSLESLISLLDDEDEHVAVSAMAELLDREQELGEVLAELQESADGAPISFRPPSRSGGGGGSSRQSSTRRKSISSTD